MDYHQQAAFDRAERDYLTPPDIPTTPEPETEQGYHGIGANKGIFVPEENALAFALERSGLKIVNQELFNAEWGKEFTDYFYSGNWVREDENEQ